MIRVRLECLPSYWVPVCAEICHVYSGSFLWYKVGELLQINTSHVAIPAIPHPRQLHSLLIATLQSLVSVGSFVNPSLQPRADQLCRHEVSKDVSMLSWVAASTDFGENERILAFEDNCSVGAPQLINNPDSKHLLSLGNRCRTGHVDSGWKVKLDEQHVRSMTVNPSRVKSYSTWATPTSKMKAGCER